MQFGAVIFAGLEAFVPPGAVVIYLSIAVGFFIAE